MNRRKLVLVFAAILSVNLLSGCGDNRNNSNLETDASYMYSDKAAKMTWELPDLDEVDPGMGKAHFISAPEYKFDNEEYSEYTISYDMKVDGTSACFAISDGRGMYGRMILCELYGPAVGNNENGMVYISTSENGIINERITNDEIKGSDDGIYHIDIECTDGNGLEVKVNEQNTFSYSYNQIGADNFRLGAVGTYKGRSQSYGYIDNIKVLSENGTAVFDENFEGENNIFSPYFSYIDNGWMRVESGYTLTEIKGVPAPYFRREFELDKKKEIDTATLYMTALGAFEVSINGNRISRDILDPGCLMFLDELDYVAYDLTDIMDKNNTMDILLTHGWFDRGQGFPELAAPWGDKLALKGELVIRYKDGENIIIPTDEQFRVSYDYPVRFDDIYQGEIIDDNFGNEMQWEKVEVDAIEKDWMQVPICAKNNEPIREVEEVYPVSVAEPISGVYVYDFGKNISGNIAVNMSGKNTIGNLGDVITFRYGETLNMDGIANSDGPPGTLWTQNLLTARATDYFCVGDNSTPSVNFRHTIHGFRYLEVRGLDAAIPVEDIKASVLSSDMMMTSNFICEDAKVYALYNNSLNSIRGNMLDNPMDCNQRDERLGWAGDAQNVSLMASYLFDTRRFYEKYLDAMVARQSDDGAFPDTAPSRVGGYGSNCWGDAPVIIAWNLYTMYGDKTIVEKYYEPCCRWVDYLVNNSNAFIRDESVVSHSYGDHLSEQTTPNEVTDTAWSAHSADLVCKMAVVVGDDEGASKYKNIYEEYKNAWNERFVRTDGSVEAGIMNEESETGYALGICFNLFDETMIQAAADRLSMLVDYSDYRFYPGYAGLSYFLPALSRYGHADTVMKVLTQNGSRTLMNSVDCQMTTMPESLDAYYFDEQGLLHIEGSLNHPAYASVCAFMYTDVLGIQSDESNPGFKHFYLKPIRDFGTASGDFNTQYGSIEVRRDDTMYHCVIPDGTSATLVMPNGDIHELEPGSYDYNW